MTGVIVYLEGQGSPAENLASSFNLEGGAVTGKAAAQRVLDYAPAILNCRKAGLDRLPLSLGVLVIERRGTDDGRCCNMVRPFPSVR